MTGITEYLREIQQTNKDVAAFDPALWNAFAGFAHEASKEGALPEKYKEILGVALAVAEHCPFCISIHAKAAIEAGATRQEIMEGGFMAVLMGGGPSMAYLRYVIDACDEFGAE
ncbi:MAG: carboxymuconolactone decarboxylase family protein [Methanofollis liminatans]|jgi:AhpD family alkylhydroperoxidase|nr:carboxymuconolactone decarboxylase family protein [Methanofollis liminatans]